MKLELQGITKTFGSLVANDHIDLVVEPGEIHALLGENGAGKSTLMNVLYGLYDPDGGQILVDDAPVTFAGPGDAMAAGIGMVHQHFMLVPVFTVAENVVLGHEPVRGGGLIDLPEARRRVKEISDRFGFHVDPDAYIEDLPGRRPAARRDHQGPVPAGQGPHPRRAHGGAHAAGDRRADRDHAPAQGVRDVDRLHHAQAARGPCRRRPDHGHPARQGGRQRRADVHRDRARLADGRPLRVPGGRAHRGGARRGDASRSAT